VSKYHIGGKQTTISRVESSADFERAELFKNEQRQKLYTSSTKNVHPNLALAKPKTGQSPPAIYFDGEAGFVSKYLI
jgi:hypothetical protein